MDKTILLVSRDGDFVSKVAELVRSRGFICVVVNNIQDAYEALKRAFYGLVIIHGDVGPMVLVKGFANGLHEHNQKVLIALWDIPAWMDLKAPFILRARIEADLPYYLEKNFQD